MTILKDVKDSDKVGLLLLFTGLLVTFLGTTFSVLVAFWVHQETTLDRVLVTVGILTSQGTGLVTAAMGVLRFQTKTNGASPAPNNGQPPANGNGAPPLAGSLRVDGEIPQVRTQTEVQPAPAPPAAKPYGR
jgi:hypothetical protein